MRTQWGRGLTSYLGHNCSATALGKPLQSQKSLPRGTPTEPLRPPPRTAVAQHRGALLPGSRRERGRDTAGKAARAAG